ncbi:flagellar hook-length control protein FliK [Ruegeria sp. R14_0]|uniref:flagellar hook-length control protein FliK n=1 Tax=Ruegeria sp. R14_0 TaxID=2821100 RepID=UPI001ADA3316|nr:flagellar hook-length control protein FliK [Ruegeria sp. R14_0]MBO9447660.1 flagellar hook-length control protein FliK [Ruegeria sp. R14_0]
MPNTLSVVTSSPTAIPKSQDSSSESGDDTGMAFAAVLDQNSDDSKDPRIGLNIAEAEPEVEAETDAMSEPESDEADAAPELAEQIPPRNDPEKSVPKTDPEPTPILVTAPVARDQAPQVLELAQAAEKRQSTRALANDMPAHQPRETTPDSPKAEVASVVPRTTERQTKEAADLTRRSPRRPHTADQSAAAQIERQQAPKTERVPSIAQMQLFASEKPSIQGDRNAGLDVEEITPLRTEAPVSTGRETSPAIHNMTPTARAEVARAVAGQMAAVVTAQPNSGTVEIALNPEELGRVSIVLNGRDDGVHLTISAERPETLDMMRRHLSVLEEEFRNFGLGDLSFDLGTSSGDSHDRADQENRPLGGAAQLADPTALVEPVTRTGLVGRIDMRV